MRKAGGAALALLTLTILCSWNRASAAESPLSQQSALLSCPCVPGQKLDVAVGLHLLNIASIEEVEELFQIDAYLFVRWKDPRLAFTPANAADTARHYDPAQIWMPKLEMVNAVAPRDRYDNAVSVSPDGTVNYVERCKATLSSKFRLRRFPFDEQNLLIVIHPFVSEAREVSFSLNDHRRWLSSELDTYSSLAQWHLETVSPIIGTYQYMDGFQASEVRFGIAVRRRSSFYLWKVLLPLLLMVFLSWATLWVEERDLQTQVTITVTTILTVIAFAFAISATMPRVPYLTYIDAFFLLCYVFVFIAMVEVMLVHVTHRSEQRRDLGIRLRRFSRWVIPGSFLLANLIIAHHFLG